MKKIKLKKEYLIAVGVILLLIMVGLGYWYARENFDKSEDANVVTEEDVATPDEDNDSIEDDEVIEEETTQTPAENYEYISQVFEAKSVFNKLEIIWDSLNSVKNEKIIFIKVYNNGAWGNWNGYPLSLDPTTKNSTYKATVTGITGTKLQYAFNFSNDNEVIRGLLIRVLGTETENISIDEIRK